MPSYPLKAKMKINATWNKTEKIRDI